MYHTHSLGINTLRTRPLSSRSFHSSSEIKTNRQGTMNTGWNARNETTAPQDHHRECSLGAEGSEPTPTGITLLPQLLCTGPRHGSDLNKGPHGCTQRHRFMHSCGVGGSSWCWRHMNQWLVLGGSYLLAIPASALFSCPPPPPFFGCWLNLKHKCKLRLWNSDYSDSFICFLLIRNENTKCKISCYEFTDPIILR